MTATERAPHELGTARVLSVYASSPDQPLSVVRRTHPVPAAGHDGGVRVRIGGHGCHVRVGPEDPPLGPSWVARTQFGVRAVSLGNVCAGIRRLAA